MAPKQIQCFFPRENQNNPWKRFFAAFHVFFTGSKFVSRVLSHKISRVVNNFHGYVFRFFHVLKLNFHGYYFNVFHVLKSKFHEFTKNNFHVKNLLVFFWNIYDGWRMFFLQFLRWLFHGSTFSFKRSSFLIFTP